MDKQQQQHAGDPRDSKQQDVKLTVAGGGWVLILMAFVIVALVAWAVGPALFREMPPGDNKNIESYGFDLSNLELDRNLVVPALRHRDMVPVMDTAVPIRADEVAAIDGRNKYLVTSDRVVGVSIDGAHRAYPILLLNVHDIIHDTLGGVPIAVTYNWHCDSVMVFDRRIEGQDGPLHFAHSGLAYNGNAIYYDRRPDMADESLWVQLLGTAVSGPLKGVELRALDYQITDWGTWRAAHPETTVVQRDPEYIRRYKKASPDTYFQSSEIPFEGHIAPLADGEAIGLKDRVFAVQHDGRTTVFPLPWLIEQRDDENVTRVKLGEGELVFDIDVDSRTAWVSAAPDDLIDGFVHALWFAWHAMEPESVVYASVE